MAYQEVNFDGLVGNTHNYAGLSYGNVASDKHKGKVSSPRNAALQGLKKMKALADMGLYQGVLPPHIRPHLPFLKSLGFQGSDAEMLAQLQDSPQYIGMCHSASNMWVANAATLAASVDSGDGKVHLTAANLSSMMHRSIEVEQTSHALKQIFANPAYFQHHDALKGDIHRDEGAANHTRFHLQDDQQGVHFFVYGKSYFEAGPEPQKFPARQTKEAFEAIARLHQLNAEKTVYALQNPDVIDQGVFHNDVISVGNGHVLFSHELAFNEPENVYHQLNQAMKGSLELIEVPDSAVSVSDAVSSYLFNSQLVTTPAGMVLIAPSNCQENRSVNQYLKSLLEASNSIVDVQFFDVKESMSNGGGPACLRLRVVLNDTERAALSGRVLLDDSLYTDLCDWVCRHYREQLHPSELLDPALMSETFQALSELQTLLELPSLYRL